MKLSRTSIGLAVRAARNAAGLTLKDLAVPAGMTISSLSRSENGERDMTFAEMTAIAAKVGIGIEDFRTLAETFERDGAASIAEGRKELARDLTELQRLAIEATIEARMTA